VGACDFLQTYDCWFRPIFAFFIVDAHAKRVVHVGVTRAPNAEWTAQQLRQVTPFEECAQVLIRDRDAKFGGEFDRVAQGVGMRVVKTAVRTPDMNATCERFLGSVRRECLDHGLILSEAHLERVLREYAISYFNAARPHQGLDQRVPDASERDSYAPGRKVAAFPVLGGLHHDYRVAARGGAGAGSASG
jgi:putative transposase